MLSHIKDIIKDAEEKGYAVGAFNVHNLESIQAVAEVAQELKSPVIIQASEGAIKYIGMKNFVNLVTVAATDIAKDVPVAFHLDHGGSAEIVYKCIEAGFTSVHIDASALPFEENLKLSKEVIDFAHQKDIWVQGEIGAIMGGHGVVGGTIEDVPIAKLEDVIEFSEKTGVDTIAAAIGTAHGNFDNEDVKIDLLKAIKEKTKKPFILHGGSGVPDEMITEAIKEGVNVINIGTDIKVAFSSTLKKTCLDNPEESDPRNLLRPCIDAVKDVVANKMKLFDSVNKA
ncbi:MAG: class II fructose-bisphosphate aldolase family protein [Patescibacteria group bacterium]|jgi:ketose-bisphosphate aldolase|nr:class II fructose-bisphosphate aldolase family protein [Patescibacteria group bacterium]